MNLSLGFIPVCILAIVVGVIYTIYFARKGLLDFEFDYIILINVLVTTSISIFALIFPITNIVQNLGPKILNSTFLNLELVFRKEIANGIFVLRISSTTIGFNTIRSILKTLKLEPNSLRR